MKTVCIYHSIDLDGWMSAAIVNYWHFTKPDEKIKSGYQGTTIPIDDIDFIGYNYGQPIPDLSEYDKVIMCDISFPTNIMIDLGKRLGMNFIWIDHHVSAIIPIEGYIRDNNNFAISGIRNTKFAACELTWKCFFFNDPMPEIVRLLGRYDCFGHKFTKEDESRRLTLLEYTKSTTRIMSQEEQDELANLNIKLLEEQKVLEFQYGARQIIANYEEAYTWLTHSLHLTNWNYDLDSPEDVIWEKGIHIYQYLCTEAKQTYRNGFEVILSEYRDETCSEERLHKFICINKERFNPINFGIDYHKEGYDGAACFHRTKDGKWAFSLYNDNGLVDCSQIAKQFGGGGHKGAAGFVLNNKDFNILIND